jgi:hypothetical protein
MAKLKTQFNDLVEAPQPKEWVEVSITLVDGNGVASIPSLTDKNEVLVIFNIQSDAMSSMNLQGVQLFNEDISVEGITKHTSACFDTIDEYIEKMIVHFNISSKQFTIFSFAGVGYHKIYYR